MEEHLSNNLTDLSEVKSKNLTVSITRKPGALVSLDISITPEATQAAYAKAVKEVSKEVSIPGFRKGKAPKDFILNNFAKQVEQSWRDILLQTSFNEAISLLPNIPPYRQDGVKCTAIKEVSKENGAKLTFEYEMAPDVPTVDLSTITLSPTEPKPVTQEQIDNVLIDWQVRLSQWEDITDRTVQEGDYLDLDIDKLGDSPEEICREARFDVADMGAWMRKAVLGCSVGDTVEATSEPEESLPPEALAQFEPTQCSITIKAIKKAKQPELTDEFAQRFGMQNMAEFRDRIAVDLNAKASQETKEELYRQLDEKLLELYPFDVPASLCQAEKDHRLKSAKEWMKQNRHSPEAMQQELQDLEATLPEQVERSCRLFFLLMSLAEKYKIRVNKSEVEEQISREILSGERSRNEGNSQEALNYVGRTILLRKTREHLLSQIA